jgi:putative membrane protein
MLMKLFDVPALLMVVKFDQLIEVLITTLIFVVIGLVVFAIAFLIMNLVTPFSIRKEIEEDHNTALAVVIGAMIIGIAMIVSAAISG